MTRRLFVRQVSHRTRLPIHHCNVGHGRGLLLVRNRELRSVRRPARRRLRNIVRLRQIHGLAAAARYRENVVGLRSAAVRLIQNPLAIRRPNRAALPVIRLAELNRPSARGAHFPQIEAPGEIRGEHNLFAVRRPGAATGCARVEEIVDRHRPRARHFRRSDFLGVGNLARIRRRGRQRDKRGRKHHHTNSHAHLPLRAGCHLRRSRRSGQSAPVPCSVQFEGGGAEGGAAGNAGLPNRASSIVGFSSILSTRIFCTPGWPGRSESISNANFSPFSSR